MEKVSAQLLAKDGKKMASTTLNWIPSQPKYGMPRMLCIKAAAAKWIENLAMRTQHHLNHLTEHSGVQWRFEPPKPHQKGARFLAGHEKGKKEKNRKEFEKGKTQEGK